MGGGRSSRRPRGSSDGGWGRYTEPSMSQREVWARVPPLLPARLAPVAAHLSQLLRDSLWGVPLLPRSNLYQAGALVALCRAFTWRLYFPSCSRVFAYMMIKERVRN